MIRVDYAASCNLAKPEKYESNEVCLSDPQLGSVGGEIVAKVKPVVVEYQMESVRRLQV